MVTHEWQNSIKILCCIQQLDKTSAVMATVPETTIIAMLMSGLSESWSGFGFKLKLKTRVLAKLPI